MKKIIQYIAIFVAVIIFIDLAGFTAWLLSNQTPADTGFIGNLTARVLYSLMY